MHSSYSGSHIKRPTRNTIGFKHRSWLRGDGGYQGQRPRAAAPKAQDMTCRRTKYKNHVDEEARRKNTTKSRVRAKVEHPFRILKRVFGGRKTACRDQKDK